MGPISSTEIFNLFTKAVNCGAHHFNDCEDCISKKEKRNKYSENQHTEPKAKRKFGSQADKYFCVCCIMSHKSFCKVKLVVNFHL